MSPPRVESAKLIVDLQLVQDGIPPPEKENNIMTQGELHQLKEAYRFLAEVRTRLPDASEPIILTRLGEVAFYEVAFSTSLCFQIYPLIRRILGFYNVCPAQLAPNAWQSMVGALVLW